MPKKLAVYAVAAMMLGSALNPASAAFPLPSPSVPPPSTASTAFGVGGGVAAGIIATAGILCIVDFWQKLNGQKNWDGSPKVVKARGHRR